MIRANIGRKNISWKVGLDFFARKIKNSGEKTRYYGTVSSSLNHK